MENVVWRLFCLMTLMPLARSQLVVGDPCTILVDGSRGSCQLFADCPWAMFQLKTRIKLTICGFSGLESIVCCRIMRETGDSNDKQPINYDNRMQSNIGQTSTGDDRPNIGITAPQREKRISEQKCDEYRSLVTEVVSLEKSGLPSLIVPRCPRREQFRGQTEVLPGEFPHMVALGSQSIGVSGIQWRHEGTLISERYVVTAAHCTYPELAVCRLGGHDLTSQDSLDVRISKIARHPNYKFEEKHDDIALLQLDRTIKFTDTIRPACLWQRADVDRPSATAVGWGIVGNTNQRSDVLMRAQLNLVQSTSCKVSEDIVNVELCAGGDEKNSCLGGSGGPLTVTAEDNPCLHYLIALTSSGYECGSSVPGVYTRISSYLQWIERMVWLN